MALPVPEYPERVLLDFATTCNLRCPMCMLWGGDDKAKIDPMRGTMDLDKATKLLDEVASAKPLIAPSIYGEPLLIPNLVEVLEDIKSRGMPVAINTNGLTLTDRIAKALCDLEVDSVMFSIDATTAETLKKVRTVDRLDKIEGAVDRLMRIRRARKYPRIGVSFTRQPDNQHEEEAFIKRWVGFVDVVRMGILFENGTFPEMETPKERKPCPVLWKTLPIHNDGSARICCLDATRQTDMGNVFKDGVKAVWHGPAFTAARNAHEEGNWDAVPFCKPCSGWQQYEFSEEVKDGLLIRRSPEYTWYNRIDRLNNWSAHGGHRSDFVSDKSG